MTHQWKVSDFIQEMGHLDKLIQRKGGDQLVQRMTMSLCTKLKAAKHWTSQAILELVDALQGSGLPNDQMKAIQEAIDCIGLNEGSHLRVTMAGQHIEGFPSYISKKDWARLEEAPKNTVHTMSILAMRLRSMGFISMREHTKRQVMSVILYLLVHKGGDPQPGPESRKRLSDEFTDVFVKAIPGAMAGLSFYPANPNELGSQWLSQVYGPDDAPALFVIGPGWNSKATRPNSNCTKTPFWALLFFCSHC